MKNLEAAGQTRGNAGTPGVDRRAFLRMAGAATVGLSLLVEACSTGAPSSPVGAGATSPPAAAPTLKSTPAAASNPGKLKLPTYVAGVGPKPDLAPTDDGVQAGYLTYPKQRVKSVQRTPGLGGEVTAIASLIGAPPTAVEQNPAWQEINKQLNVTVKLQSVAQADYPTRTATLMAGNDLPDLFYLAAVTAGMPQFLKSSYADLTPYLAGDAVKEYPNLAAFPPAAWKNSTFDGAIYAIPNLRAQFQYTWFVNQTWMDRIGASHPRNADEFKRLLVEMTHPDSNQWGIAELSPGFGLVYTGRGDAPQVAMFGAPNNWAVDASGTFTKDYETEQFKAALGYVRDLYAAGVFHPDRGMTNSTEKTYFMGGRAGIVSNGWLSYPAEFWDVGLKQSPPIKIRVLDPLSHDGSKPVRHRFAGGLYGRITAIKNGPPERVKELLRVMDYIAAPFGSQESLLMEYGVQEVDFTFDTQGNPVKTEKGKADTGVPWFYLAVHPAVLYDANDSEFVRTAYAEEQKMVPIMIDDPSVGLYSATDAAKGATLTQKFADGIGDIVTGASPLSAFDQLVKDWRTAGGDQMRTEYQQLYADSKA
jgi:putative aldouronate transport system substrate-binding protein